MSRIPDGFPKMCIRDRIGMMLDEAGLYDRLSCIDNLDIYRRLYQLPYNVIEPALRRVSLYDSRQKAVIKLSKGMKQRLSFARASVSYTHLGSEADSLSEKRLSEYRDRRVC